jgi:hypothetical protein
MRQKIVCNCWFRGNADSDAMWKIYSNQLGATIVTSAQKLEGSIEHCYDIPKSHPECRLVLAPVIYDDRLDCGDCEPWLLKRRAFAHESEARLYMETEAKFETGMRIKVNLASLVDEIVISPFATAWQADAIQIAIRKVLSPP